jgi:hypothetical protein
MKMVLVFFALALVIMAPHSAHAWDVVYSGSVLPDDPSLGTDQWIAFSYNDPSTFSTDGHVLRMDVPSANPPVSGFHRYAIPAHRPITMEARVRVTDGVAGFWAGTGSYCVFVTLFLDHIHAAALGGSISADYSADLSAFRTVRIATNSQGLSFVWLDGDLVMRDTTTRAGNNTDLSFHTYGPSVSYWDYVAYSQEFLPVPEPSSVAAILAGVGGLGAMVKRRRT